MKLEGKINELTDEELILLSKELRLPTVADDAFLRQVIKGTEYDSGAPILAFIAVGQLIQFEIAERFFRLIFDHKVLQVKLEEFLQGKELVGVS